MVALQDIQHYVGLLVARFHPQSVLLFGSQAAGTAGAESDVDLLVVMDHNKARDVEQEIEIDRALPREFPLDILVRRPDEMRRRLASHDMALATILRTGKVLYGQPGSYA